VTTERERHPSCSSKSTRASASASTTSVEKCVITETGNWSKLATCYLFPPLKEVWEKMVPLGWIMPDDAIPTEEVHDNEAMLIDHQR